MTSVQSCEQDDRLVVLEAIRGLAAFYVVLHHFAHFLLQDQYPRFARLFVFGQPAVMVFFVMSGFVIFHSTTAIRRQIGFREYFIRRFRRIYPLFTIALILAYFGNSAAKHSFVTPDYVQLLGNVVMLQDGIKPGSWFAPFMGNTPLWSLSYEWFFYTAFFPIHSLLSGREQLQKWVVLGLGLVGYLAYRLLPNQFSFFLMYFMLWWSGVELAREYRSTGRVSWRGQAFQLLAIPLLALVWFLEVRAAWATGNRSPWDHPMLELRHFVTTWAVLVMGLIWYRLKGFGFLALFGWARHLAPISYALYICHVPVIDLAKGLQLTGSPAVDCLWALPLVFGIAYLLEIKLQPWINKRLPATQWSGAIA
jgi:peptidoglycan/LPS O-acetylase OafA/YrhL